MRRPMLMAVLLAAALVLVVGAKWQLDKAIKDGTFGETKITEAPASQPGDDFPNSVDIGIQQDPKVESAAPVHQAAGATKTDVMAALVSARQMFKSKPAAQKEVAQNPHSTPPTIIQAAEALGTIATLEQQNPAYKPEFQAFYIECAKDSDVLTVTRAQCLESYVKSKELKADEIDTLLVDIDPTVKQLYREISR